MNNSYAFRTHFIVLHSLYGAFVGSICAVIGATVLKAYKHDQYIDNTCNVGVDGFIGGLIVHTGIGLIATLERNDETQVELHELAASGLVAALTAAPAGNVIHNFVYHVNQLHLEDALYAGATGSNIIAGAFLLLVIFSIIFSLICAMLAFFIFQAQRLICIQVFKVSK